MQDMDRERPMKRGASPEFSRPFPLERLGQEPRTVTLEASAAEREALARRFDLLRLDALTADLTVAWIRGRRVVEVRGYLRADVTQRCVVTLAPVTGTVAAPFVQRYSVTSETAEEEARTVVLDPEGEDPPEPVGADGVDLGEAVAQELMLALDPYPRAPGAVLPAEGQAGDRDPEAAVNPFAVLKSLKGPPPA